jgi:hypothetical protein
MTVLDRINLYTLRRFDMIDAEKFNRLHAQRNAGDRLEDLSTDTREAVKEVIRVCRDRDERYEQTFDELRLQIYAYPHASGNGVAWGINSLATGLNTKRGIVE